VLLGGEGIKKKISWKRRNLLIVVVAHVLFVDGGVVPATFQFNLAPFYLSCKMCVCVCMKAYFIQQF
jgi:hypothetical protein